MPDLECERCGGGRRVFSWWEGTDYERAGYMCGRFSLEVTTE